MEVLQVFALILTFGVVSIDGKKMKYLREVMESIKYEKLDRPNINGEHINVTNQMYVASLGPMKEGSFIYEVGIFFRQWWNDPRLSMNRTNEAITITLSPEEIIWVPDTFIINSREVTYMQHSVRTIIQPNGDVYVSRRMKATCNCQMLLQNYPMDRQICPFVLENYAYNDSDVQLYWHLQKAVFHEEQRSLQLVGYVLEKISVGRVSAAQGIGADVEYFSNLYANFTVRRTFAFYLTKVYMPSILLMIFSSGSYWIPYTAIPARITLLTTTFLANAFILQSVTEATARVDQTTAMQNFLMVNILFFVLAIIEYLVILTLKRKEHHTKKSIPVLTAKTIKDVDGLKEICLGTKNEMKKRHEHRDASEYPEPHKLDRISRVLLPGAYCIYCVMYFVYYMLLVDSI